MSILVAVWVKLQKKTVPRFQLERLGVLHVGFTPPLTPLLNKERGGFGARQNRGEVERQLWASSNIASR
ncbi:hypothetical protein SD80_000445 [Scytonema tolypothrichoides VB-61278]|nr:hypothetical protein SD80_000445 [Scytonema tolypothrichoides VB-61278]